MIVIEFKEQPNVRTEQSIDLQLAYLFNLDHLFIERGWTRCLVAFVKGLAAYGVLCAVSGFTPTIEFGVGASIYMASLLVLYELTDQHVSGRARHTNFSQILKRLKGVSPAFLALIPVVLLLMSLSAQSILTGMASLIEVTCISCGVPFLLFGIIKAIEKAPEAIRHLTVGLSTILSGIILSGTVSLMFSNFTDASILTQSTYFSDAIAAIYSTDIILSVEHR